MRLAGVAALVVALALPAHADAAFPGANGKIAFVDDFGNIGSINPDGSGQAQLTTDPAWDGSPDWSPDGARILFTSNRGGLGYQIYVMNADGTGQTRLTDPPAQAGSAAWSPDGRRLVFMRTDGFWLMDADGTDQTLIASPAGSNSSPDWSPDGSLIVFERDYEIWVIEPDGTGLSQVTALPPWPPTTHSGPDWSPDGTRIVYQSSYDADGEYCTNIVIVRPDGTGGGVPLPETCESGVSGNYYGVPAWSPDGTRIASSEPNLVTVRVDGSDRIDLPVDVYDNDWQPLPADTLTNSHIRPKGASPVHLPLVPAAKPCTTPNREHGPPLAFGSCNPPQPGSTYLTVGVGDGSPAFSRSVGSVRMDVQVGAPGAPEDSDVLLRFSLTNVMRASDLSEYTGELRSELTVRRTDRDGLGLAPHSTSMDFPFGFTVPCNPTPGSSIDASSCVSFTSVNAVIPLAVKDTNRAVWALDKLRVYDGGPDEDADTDADNSLFMTQGIFVP